MNNTQSLPVRLTESELLTKGAELSAMVKARAYEEEERKSVVATYKARITDLDAQIQKLAQVVRDKRELRPVDVVEQPDHDAMMMRTIRLDTGEVVSSRALEGAERQRPLFGLPDRATTTPAMRVAAIKDDIRRRSRSTAECEYRLKMFDDLLNDPEYVKRDCDQFREDTAARDATQASVDLADDSIPEDGITRQ